MTLNCPLPLPHPNVICCTKVIVSFSLPFIDNVVPSITVLREGLFGSVSVDVAKGSPPGTFPDGFAAGQVVITSSPLSFTGSKRSVTFSARVSAHSLAVVFCGGKSLQCSTLFAHIIVPAYLRIALSLRK